MKEANDLCSCLEKMRLNGRLVPYSKKLNFTVYNSSGLEEGTLCLINNIIRDNGYYEKYEWKSNFEMEIEAYPINYCPICGKEIEYKQMNIKKMTM